MWVNFIGIFTMLYSNFKNSTPRSLTGDSGNPTPEGIMRKYKKMVLATSLSLTFANNPAVAVGVTQSVEDALNFYHYGKSGAVKFDLNTRWENVNQGAGSNNPVSGLPVQTANGFTSRLRAGLLSPTFYGFQGYAEYEGNLAMVEDFNSTRNGLDKYSTIADPQQSELNQLWLSYNGIPDTIIKVGR
jgi:hypothetical protein